MENRNFVLLILCLIITLIIICFTFYAVLKRKVAKWYYVFLFISVLILLGLTLFYLFTNKFGESRISILTKILSSFGTGIVIVLSLWGDRIRQSLNPSKCSIKTIPGKGEIAKVGTNAAGDILEIYFHLRVVNENPPSTIKGCTVLLKRIRLLTPGNRKVIAEKDFFPPYSFPWALTYKDDRDRRKYNDISYEGVFDFVRFNMEKKKAMPVLVDYFRDIETFFGDEKYIMEYTLQIDSDNYKSEKQQIFEVRWDGSWTDDPETIANDVIIKEVPEKE